MKRGAVCCHATSCELGGPEPQTRDSYPASLFPNRKKGRSKIISLAGPSCKKRWIYENGNLQICSCQF